MVIYWNVLQRSLSLNSGLGAGQPPTQAAFSDCGIPFPNLSSSSDGNSGQDESLEQSTDLDTSLAAATVGPCLAKLDPAVAQAVQQRFQVSSTLKLFPFSACFLYKTLQPLIENFGKMSISCFSLSILWTLKRPRPIYPIFCHRFEDRQQRLPEERCIMIQWV